MRSYTLITIFLFVVTFLVYGNSLVNKLFFDDEELIYKNEYVKQFTFFPRYFTENMIAGAHKVSNMYRPILLTSFAIDYLIWKENPFGFHLTNIFLHAINGILIFFLISRLFKMKWVAFLTSLFFVVHPINSEAIIYASGRTDPLTTFFTLSSLYCFLCVLEQKKYISLFYLSSLILFLLALLTKETAIVIPFLLFILALVREQYIRKKVVHFFIILAPFFLCTLSYIFLRLTLLNFNNTLNFYTTPTLYSQHISIRLFTFTYVFFTYLSILFFPKDLIVARSVPFINSFFSPSVLLFLCFIFFLFFFSFKYWSKERLLFFSLSFFFLTILPTSGIIPINNIMTEHYLYLPSISFFLFISYGILFLFRSFPLRKVRVVFISFITFIFFFLSVRTIIRTFDWRDPITFYTKELRASPWHIPMRHNLAMTYADQGDFTRALSEYKKIIHDADIYPNTHHNLANIYRKLGTYKEAEKEYENAITLDPHFYFSYYALSDLYRELGETGKAEEIMRKMRVIQNTSYAN